MITYTNVENFEAWLKKILKNYYGNINDYLTALELQYSASGTACYEQESYMTISGKPECYWYEVQDLFDDEDDNAEFIGRSYIL